MGLAEENMRPLLNAWQRYAEAGRDAEHDMLQLMP